MMNDSNNTRKEERQLEGVRVIRLGLIGSGAIAPHHIRAFAQASERQSKKSDLEPHQRFRFVVVAAIDANLKTAEQLVAATRGDETISHMIAGDCRVFQSYDELLAEEEKDSSFVVDAIDVMVPHDLHKSIGIQVIQSRKHLLMEKPLATNLEDCVAIINEWNKTSDSAAATDSKKVFMVGENSQYWPEVIVAKRLLDAGAIGDLITVRAFYREALLDSRKDWGQEDLPIEAWAKLLGWRAILEKSGGGVVIDGGQHWLRPLQILVGNIEEVIGATSRPFEALEGETLAHGLIRFEKPHSHIIGTLECLYVAATVLWNLPQFIITGTKGEIIIGGQVDMDVDFGASISLMNRDDYPKEIDPLSEEFLTTLTSAPPGSWKSKLSAEWPSVMQDLVGITRGYLGSFTKEMINFGEAIVGTREIEVSPINSLNELRATLALYKSASTRQWEKLPPIPEFSSCD